jgi:hypothetical protein
MPSQDVAAEVKRFRIGIVRRGRYLLHGQGEFQPGVRALAPSRGRAGEAELLDLAVDRAFPDHRPGVAEDDPAPLNGTTPRGVENAREDENLGPPDLNTIPVQGNTAGLGIVRDLEVARLVGHNGPTEDATVDVAHARHRDCGGLGQHRSWEADEQARHQQRPHHHPARRLSRHTLFPFREVEKGQEHTLLGLSCCTRLPAIRQEKLPSLPGRTPAHIDPRSPAPVAKWCLSHMV